MNEFKAGVCINYISIVIRLSTSFFMTPFVIEKLGMDEYGLFMLSNVIISWLTLTDFGLAPCIGKYVSTYQAKQELDKQAHFLGQCCLLFLLLGFITLIAGLVCYCYLDAIFPKLTPDQLDTLEVLYLLTLSNLALSFPLRPLTSIAGAYLKFTIPGIVNLATSILNAGLTILLLYLGYKAIALTVLSVSLAVAGMIWGVYYSVKILGARLRFSKPDIPLYKEMFGFSFWVFLNQIMDLFYWKAGTPIVTSLAGASAATIFTLGVSFSYNFITASTSISCVFAPKIMHMVALGSTPHQLTELMIKVGRMQLAVLSIILLGFITFGQSFLTLWVGDTVGSDVSTVYIGALCVLIPLVIPLTQNTGLAILQALSIHKGRAIILFYTSITGVIIGYILTSFWGPLGMFIGTAISLFIGQNFLINRYYAKRAKLEIASYFRQTYFPIAPIALVALLLGYATMSMLDLTSWLHFIIAAVIYGSLLALAIFFFYLNKEEKDHFLAPIRKIIRI